MPFMISQLSLLILYINAELIFTRVDIGSKKVKSSLLFLKTLYYWGARKIFKSFESFQSFMPDHTAIDFSIYTYILRKYVTSVRDVTNKWVSIIF